MQLKSIYNKKLSNVELKMYFWTLLWSSNKKKSINWHYFCHVNFFSNDLFRATLYRLVSITQRCAVPFKLSLKCLLGDKRSSLLIRSVVDEVKKFNVVDTWPWKGLAGTTCRVQAVSLMRLASGDNVIKLFKSVIYKVSWSARGLGSWQAFPA